jgi:uncharacterized protein (DUF1778 family)
VAKRRQRKTRTAQFNIKCFTEERVLLEQAVAASGPRWNLSRFIMEAAVDRAKQVLGRGGKWSTAASDEKWRCDTCGKDIQPGQDFIVNEDQTEGYHLNHFFPGYDLATSDENWTCDSCGKAIKPGQEFLVKQDQTEGYHLGHQPHQQEAARDEEDIPIIDFDPNIPDLSDTVNRRDYPRVPRSRSRSRGLQHSVLKRGRTAQTVEKPK